MIAFIDEHRDAYGVEPICRVLPIAPSSYRELVAQRRDPGRRSVRSHVMRYSSRKSCGSLPRTSASTACARSGGRCSGKGLILPGVARLMRDLGLQGAIRGKPVRTTISDKAAPCPLDHVNRQFKAPAPNRLWFSDFTYVATWAGFAYVAFVIDVYARYVVGWRGSRTAHTSFVLDDLEQAIHDRRPVHRGGLVHHSDRGSQTSVAATPSAWRRPGSNRLSAASETATTTPWPRA